MDHFPSLLFFLLSILLSISLVEAHGFLGKVTIDGTDFSGPSPQDPPSSSGSSAIRQVADIGPVKGASNDDLRCGLSAASASQEASAKPGSQVEFWWTGGGGQQWPHDTGPLMTYMAECTNGDCTSFDPSNAKWFKIDQLGMNGDSSWYQTAFMQGKSLSVTLPNALSAGHYLLRSEIIALHIATSVGGAEFYPACVQLNIASSGSNAISSPSPTVSFPGAYSDNDPGIYVPKIYDPGLDYVFPGGPISNLPAAADSSGSSPASSSSNSTSSAGSSASGSSTGTASSSAPTSPAGSGGIGSGSGSSVRTCKLAKRSGSTVAMRKRGLRGGLERAIGHWVRLREWAKRGTSW